MMRVEEALERAGLEAVIIGQVHDSILLDCPNHELAEVTLILHAWMTDWTTREFPFLKIPLVADVTSGPNYKDQDTTHERIA